MRLDNAITKVKRGWLTLMEDQQHRIRDFSRWQDEKIYREKLQRLLQDLTKK
jgi:hypothetical protein